ncbi:DUF2291 domain-containing protein [Streptomyces phaeochromogenes]|uniref:DUF2291 domain-containing protein n=1 Tax=Streptomyces phaeochromogenes TaxID=1923 RepID=A0ABZ1HA12_STRPH|nr:DUF2291 domain-containing protein [Streptomyces phaeochromogenes]WSD14396.1 DUF2291 domain-containing protein [Streptomyces phaeochromogenes]
MTTPDVTSADRKPAGPWAWLTLGRGCWAALVLLVTVIGLTTTYQSSSTADAQSKPKFDPAQYASKTFMAKVVPAVKKNAVDITTLHKAIAADPEAAGQRYGHRAGTGPYSYSVSLTGTAGEARSGLLPVTMNGLGKVRVSVQIGPVVSGTALRDAPGFIKFGQFTNQVEYADAATALNAEMKTKVLASFDAEATDGKKVTVIGAMTPLTGDVLTITPVSIEVAS